MTEVSKDVVKNIIRDMNVEFFNSHVREIIWSKERRECVIKMDTKNEQSQKEEFKFTGDDAMLIFKKLTY
jgi:hypothetical protein